MAVAGDVTGGLTGIVRSLSAGMRNLGAAMTAASAGIAAAMGGLARRAERVSEAFREVDTITSSSASSQERYGDLVSDLNTEFGLQEGRLGVIEGLYQSVSAGVDEAEQSQRAFLETSARLATVGRVELATTVDVLSTVVNTYGKDAEFAERASNALFATVQFGKVTMEELAPVMGRVAALGSEMSISIEELGASMAILTRNGFEARIAATGLRATMRSLMRPSEDMKTVLRDIALENDLFAQSMGKSADEVRSVAQEYRETTDAIRGFEDAQESARKAVEENSLVIQEARLLQEAIEQGRRDEIEETISTQELRGQSIEQLDQIIEEHRLEVNKARVEEEQARLEQQELEQSASELENRFTELMASSGDLQDGVGQLVVEQEGFVETMTRIREEADEQGIAFDNLFKRSRALQASLSLVGEDGEALNQVFAAMGEDGEITEEKMQQLTERFDITREEIEEAQAGVEEIAGQFEETTGPTQNLGDAVSELSESLDALGGIFVDDVISAVNRVDSLITGFKERIESLTESQKDTISRFLALASAIGLVLGPLLLFGGQIALITSSIGIGLIPLLGIVGGLFGTLAIAFNQVTDGGSDADELLSSMESTLSSLTGFVSRLADIFKKEVLPGMKVFAQGLIDVFSATFDSVSEETSEGESVLRQFGSFVGDVFESVGNVLSNNADDIANFVGTIVGVFFNEVVPAIERFVDVLANTIIPELQELATKIYSQVKPAVLSMVDGIQALVSEILRLLQTEQAQRVLQFLEEKALSLVTSITDLIVAFGKFLQENEELAIKLGAAIGVFGTLASVLIPICLVPGGEFSAHPL